MTTQSTLLVASTFLCALIVGFREAQDISHQTINIQGQSLSLQEGKESLVSLLKSDDPKDRTTALDVLRRDLALVIDEHGQLHAAVRMALAECYHRLPPFPSGTRICETNVLEITRSAKVFALCTLARCGGEEGQEILNSALQGEDPIMKKIAEKQKQILASAALPLTKACPEAGVDTSAGRRVTDEPVTDLTNRIARTFADQSPEKKKAVLRDIKTRRKELGTADRRQLRDVVVSTLKAQVAVEKNSSVVEDIVTTVAAIEERQAAVSYLKTLIQNPKTSRLLKSHARYLCDAIEQGVFR